MTSPDATRDQMKALLLGAFEAGVKAAHPDQLFANEALREKLKALAAGQKGRVVIVGAGKASAAMAVAFEREWTSAGGVISDGVVATRDGYECPTQWTEVIKAGHPYPDDRGIEAAERLLSAVADLNESDLVVGLWSGGGSSLLTAPAPGVSAKSVQDLCSALVDAGADIFQINTVRRHLLAASGGRLAVAAAPAQVLNIVLPDVVNPANDDLWLATIASGPSVPDPTTLADAREVLKDWDILPAQDVTAALSNPEFETPSSWHDIGVSAETSVVLPGDAAVDAAASFLEDHFGEEIHMITPDPAGNATELGVEFGRGFQQDDMGVGIFLCGGEMTVEVGGPGIGGPNQEFALAMALTLEGHENIYALSADTDGIDGKGDHAGAFIAPDTLQRLEAANIDPGDVLMNNDTAAAFAAIGDAIVTGPTFTNVNDLRLIVING